MEKLTNIYASFRRLTPFTQVWMMVALGPAIFLPLFALNGPLGIWVAVLSILGFAPAPFMIWTEEGFSRGLSLAHVIFWPFLLALVIWYFSTNGFSGSTADFIYAINSVVLAISLVFDVREVRAWTAGQKAVA